MSTDGNFLGKEKFGNFLKKCLGKFLKWVEEWESYYKMYDKYAYYQQISFKYSN